MIGGEGKHLVGCPLHGGGLFKGGISPVLQEMMVQVNLDRAGFRAGAAK
jgi:hypothetical protein